MAYTETDENGLTADGTPPGRLLSISGLFFDPGDQNALSARYQALGMTPLEERYSFVAAKLKETLSPNLPLAWGIPTVDGFGGGLLPTRHYVEFMALAYPDGVEVAVDGRLRENLALEECRGACVPWDVAHLLDMDYILVDKVYDVWHEGIAFDTATYKNTYVQGYDVLPLAPQGFSEGGNTYFANEVQALLRCTMDDPEQCVEFDDPQNSADGGRFPQIGGLCLDQDRIDQTTTNTACDPNRVYDPVELISIEPDMTVAVIPLPPGEYSGITRVRTNSTTHEVLGVTLVNNRLPNQFLQLSHYGIPRILSSDIKLYTTGIRNLRAYVGSEYPDGPPIMGGTGFGFTTLIPEGGTTVNFQSYTPTRVEIEAQSLSEDNVLVLQDSYYPGWTATVNESPVTVYRANVNFRAVPLPTGTSRVIFEYNPWWYPGVLVFGVVAWGLTTIMCIFLLWRRQRD
jgi:hypothetical protein